MGMKLSGFQLSPQLLFYFTLPWVLGLALVLLAEPVTALFSTQNEGYNVQRTVLLYATLPRVVMALLCGAGLAVSGAILQQVLRNPIASPDTLGVSAGARLALVIVSVFFPSVLGIGRDVVALLGAAFATTLVLLIARQRQFSPLSLILAGLVVSLYCGALSTVMVLLKDRYLVSLFIWGSGSLSQQSWEPAIGLGWRILLLMIPVILLVRPLSLMELGDDVAKSLGVSLSRIRVLAIGLAVLLAAYVTSSVGYIGFIGFAGPIIAKLSGVRKFSQCVIWSGIFGALLLLVVDLAVQILAGDSAMFLPTGAVTAVLGSPLLLLLLPRLKSMVPPNLQTGVNTHPFAPLNWTKLKGFFAITLSISLVVSLFLIGRGPDGSWSLLGPDAWHSISPWRVPRFVCAAGAGGLLAIGGYVLQRVTGNPMASPEIMGVSAGAILAAAIILFLFPATSSIGVTAASVVGAFVAIVILLTLSMRAPSAPERILLVGIALTALVDALVGVLMATGEPSSVMLLAWLSGSTNGADPGVALVAIGSLLLLLFLALLSTRWLTILPLGRVISSSIGVPVSTAQLVLFLLVAVITAIATPIIGPLTFVGLIAPHLVNSLGIRKPKSGLLLSALTGAIAMMCADTLARTIAFPLQLSTGIVASLVAGPVLMLMLARSNRQSANAMGGD
ncbi:MAG: Fe(3+)-hydroxamate ABC transporter permease FhuB [Ketobacter sp.]